MSARKKMHADEFDIDGSLVARLLAAQFSQWADRRLAAVDSAGTDNALYRLGDDMVVRLPRIPAAVARVDKEHRWLPELAPLLPLSVPVPLARGTPAEGCPWPWSVYRWLDGSAATVTPVEPGRAANQLAGFVAALHESASTVGHDRGAQLLPRRSPRVARPSDAPRPGRAPWGGRRRGRQCSGDEALAAPAWRGPDVWLHGDLQPANLLVARGELTSVIDFGCLGVGDPGCDVMVAWTALSAESRGVFRALLGVDDATWTRARGWALSIALVMLPYYTTSNPVLANIARCTIHEALTDAPD